MNILFQMFETYLIFCPPLNIAFVFFEKKNGFTKTSSGAH